MSRTCITTLALMLMAAIGRPAAADPVMGTIELTAGPDSVLGGDVFSTNQDYPSVPVDLSDPSVLSKGIPLPGPQLLNFTEESPNGGPMKWGHDINTSFDLRITFDGSSGAHPYVELTGTLTGVMGEGDAAYNLGGFFTATPTSAVLHDWTPDSGVSLSVIDPFLNPGNYQINGAIEGGFQDLSGFLFYVNPSSSIAPIPAPEPSTLLIYAAAIAGAGIRYRVRRRRDRPSRAA